MDVTLHVGAHRTGTTTLQRFLEANRSHLAAQGIGVWGPRRTRDGLFAGLVKAPNRITVEDMKRGDRSTGLIRVELARAELAGLRHMIVSEENMIGSMENNVNLRRLYPHAKVRIERFAGAFGTGCSRILLTIRSYDRHWASTLGFCLKIGYNLPDATLLKALVAQPIRWSRIVRDISTAFPEAEIIVSPFEGMVGLPEHQLETLLGFAPAGPFSATREWHNASPDRRGLASILSDYQGQDVPQGEHALRTGIGPWQPFTEDQRALMRAAYSQDLAWLRAGADGLATYIDSPDSIPGALGQNRGRNDREEHRRLG